MPNGCLVSGQCHCRRRMDKSPVSCSAGGTSCGQAWRRRRRALGGGRWPKLRCCWQASYGATFNARSVWNGTLCLYNWYAVTAWESSGNGGRDGRMGGGGGGGGHCHCRSRLCSSAVPRTNLVCSASLALLSHSDMQPSRPRRRPSLVCRPTLESKQ
jgi:hypothetical protein